jgi:hypothetical protein
VTERIDSQVLFLAMGYPYLVMAINAALSVRQAGSTAHIKLISNHPIERIRLNDVDVFDRIEVAKRDTEENRWIKTRIIDHADGAKNVFLDCDVEVRASIDPLMGLLDNFDLAGRSLPYEKKHRFNDKDGDNIDSMSLSEINTGVLLFGKGAGARELFDLWHRYFLKMGAPADQPSFLKALLATRTTRFFPLPPMWNASPYRRLDAGAMKENPSAIRILHYRDPSSWPSVGGRLGKVHENAVFDLVHPSSEFSSERGAYSGMARRYRSHLYKHSLGRFWLEKTFALSSDGRGSRLRKVGLRKPPTA